MSADLFAPFTPGDLTPANRKVMAPMTRNRADTATFHGGGEDGCTDYPLHRSEYLAA